GFRECAQQGLRAITLEQRIPVGAPDYLDHVPAGTGEHTLELIDDPAVATHRTIEPLQVAVDHEDQVVELLAGGERQRASGLGFIHLAVAEEAPDLAIAGGEQLPVLEIAHE